LYQPTIIHQNLNRPRPKARYRKGSEGGLTNKRSSNRSTRSYSTRQPIEVQLGVGSIGLRFQIPDSISDFQVEVRQITKESGGSRLDSLSLSN
jgi:hypothetical protein